MPIESTKIIKILATKLCQNEDSRDPWLFQASALKYHIYLISLPSFIALKIAANIQFIIYLHLIIL